MQCLTESVGEESAVQKLLRACMLKRKPRGLVRVLVEGGNEDDWASHTVDRDEYVLPLSTKTLLIARYSLDLVARVGSSGVVESVSPTFQGSTKNVGYPLKYFGFRPCIVVTEDGRLFLDEGLSRGEERLRDFLGAMRAECGRVVSKNHMYEQELKRLSARNG